MALIDCINKQTGEMGVFEVSDSVALYIKQLEGAIKYPHLTKIQNVYPHLKPIEVGSERWNRQGPITEEFKCDFNSK
jgi:hypothetical protein